MNALDTSEGTNHREEGNYYTRLFVTRLAFVLPTLPTLSIEGKRRGQSSPAIMQEISKGYTYHWFLWWTQGQKEFHPRIDFR